MEPWAESMTSTGQTDEVAEAPLARIHRRRASGQRPEAVRRCSRASGIMVCNTKPTPEKEHLIDATT